MENEKTMNPEFISVEKAEYARNLLARGFKVIKAEKSGCVYAKKVTERTEFDVWTEKGTLESHEVAQPGEWILTRATLEGKVVLNKNGRPNQWKISEEKLFKKYDVLHIREDGFVKPKGGVQMFILIPDNIQIMVPWGDNDALVPQRIEAGGVLNITALIENPGDPDPDIYGIAEKEFGDTYRVICS